MEQALLATKLQIPPETQDLVRRDRLIETVESGIPNCRIVVISAPAGYGKTALLGQWARGSRYRVAWLTVGKNDDDTHRLLRYLLAAWEQIQPDVRESPLGLLLGSMAPETQAVLSAFVNAANDLPEHTVFVLDDCHLITDSNVQQALTFLVDNLPPTLHFVLAGRSDPSLPLARYRARDELLEVRSSDLQFTNEEMASFLRRKVGFDLGDDALGSLQAQLEGWAAGLQLAALPLRRQSGPPERKFVTGRHRFVSDYLREDVLAHLPDDRQRFLLQTSILDSLCGELCDVVTGNRDGQTTLEALERENLFAVPLDDHREWFRYHRLFAEFLREELNRRYPSDVAALHQRAGRWYLASDLPDEAFRHAIAGGDLDLTIQIGERYMYVKLHGGEFSLLAEWLDLIPPDWYAAYPTFGLARAGLLAFNGDFEACTRHVDEAEAMLLPAEHDNSRWQLARVVALRCFMACIQNDLPRAETLAEQALRGLRDDDHTFRADTYHALGDTYRRNGQWELAHEHYLRALDYTRSPTYAFQSVHVFGALADLELRQGHMRNAAGYWRKALAALKQPASWGRVPLPVAGWVYLRFAEILYEWNQLRDAGEYLQHGLERAELGGDARAMIAGYLLAGRLKLSGGDLPAAEEYLGRVRHLLEDAQFPDWTGRFERFQLELWLAQNRLRAAVLWADSLLDDDTLQSHPEPEVARMAIARISIVKGDGPSVEQALSLLKVVVDDAEQDGRVGLEIEALGLRALGLAKRGEMAGALTELEHSMRLAEPEGYLRLFTDLGSPMIRLLQEARSRGVMPDYADTILVACGPDPGLSPASTMVLTEPLTARELEILGLIAVGLTNRQIADRLYISAETVKKHTGNIFGKLNVHSRTEAATRARDLDLLDSASP